MKQLKALIVTCALIWSVLFAITSVQAGTPGCSNVTTVSGDYYAASASDCIIRVQNAFSFTAAVVELPNGGEFTVQDDSAFEGDYCEFYQDEEYPEWSFTYCSPRGITVRAASGQWTIDYGQDTTLAGQYFQGSPYRQSVQLSPDGVSNWTATYSSWR